MNHGAASLFTSAALARAARGEIEEALGPDVVARWPWSERLSHIIDMWVWIEEQGDADRTLLGLWRRPI